MGQGGVGRTDGQKGGGRRGSSVGYWWGQMLYLTYYNGLEGLATFAADDVK